jgi:hypothetical protein
MAEKPIVHLIHKSEAKLIPFDVAPYRTVYVSWETPADVLHSVELLHEHVKAAISPDHDVENPVTKARGRQHLKATATPPEKVLLEEMQVLSARVTELEQRPTFTYAAGTYAYPSGIHDPDQRISSYSPGTVIVTTVDPRSSGPADLSFTPDKAFVRNLNVKAAVLADTTDRDGKVTATVGGEQVRLAKDEWEKLPIWTGRFP